jgi:hypothetical protein
MRNIGPFTWLMGGALAGFVAAVLLFAAFTSPGDGLGMLIWGPIGMTFGVLAAIGVKRWVDSVQ